MTKKQIANRLRANSLNPRDAYMRQWTRPSLVQIMACRLFGAKTLSKPMLTYCHLDHWEYISMKFQSVFKDFHWKNALQNVVCKMVVLSRPQCVRLNLNLQEYAQRRGSLLPDDVIQSFRRNSTSLMPGYNTGRANFPRTNMHHAQSNESLAFSLDIPLSSRGSDNGEVGSTPAEPAVRLAPPVDLFRDLPGSPSGFHATGGPVPEIRIDSPYDSSALWWNLITTCASKCVRACVRAYQSQRESDRDI